MRLNDILIKMLYIIVFITGATGLIYEVTWQKYLSRLIGSDSIATAIILAAFLGGLSIGYFICGKISTQIKNHLKAYAIMEGIIGVWCIFFPNIYHLVDTFSKSWEFSPPFLIMIQGFFCSLLLMGIPTICMGGTIPFLTRGLSAGINESTHVHASVYAINTAGAFIGTLLAGFYLIVEYGLPLTIIGTGFINLLIFIIVYIFQKWIPVVSENEVIEVEKDTRIRDIKINAESIYLPKMLYLIAFLGGFYFMTLENVLIRITNFSLGSSAYSFSLIVAVFIISIATGSFILGRMKKLYQSYLFINQLLITCSLFFIYLTLDTWPYVAHLVRITIQNNILGFWAYYLFSFLILLFILIIPVGLMGATVPIAFHEIKKDFKNIGRNSGYLFSFNTIGNLTGSLIGGVLFYYFLNNEQIFLVSILLASISTSLAAWKLSKRKFGVSCLVVCAAFILILLKPFYNQEYFASGTFRFRNILPYSLKGVNGFYEKFNQSGKLKYYKDGPTTTVGVLEIINLDGKSEGMSIMVNGKSDSSTKMDIYTLKLSAHIPSLFSEKIEDVMLIGIGTGVTCGELALYDEVKNIDVAEISPFVADALPLFGKYTNNVHNNPKLNILIGDAFRIIERSDKKWDMIISEPSNIWVTGVDLLFTQEFYRIVKEQLNPGGSLLQWFHMYAADTKMMGMIINTINSVFPYHHIFITDYGDALVLAKNKEITIEDLKRAQIRLKMNDKVARSIKQINITSIEEILIRELWPSSYTATLTKNSGMQTLDNPRLHYIAGKNFFLGKRISIGQVFPSETAFHYKKFLLVKLYEDWLQFPFTKEKFESILLSLKNINQSSELPIVNNLKIKAYLYNPGKFSIDKGSKRKINSKLFKFIISPQEDDEWKKVGLYNSSIRFKAQHLINHIHAYRNWINPFPIDGLLSLLKNGIHDGVDPLEKNWCSLQLISILLNEGKNKDQAKVLFDSMIRDKNGKLFLKEMDRALLMIVENKLHKTKNN